MKAFLYQVGIQWKLNIRNKEILIHYYFVPLVFYLFIGGVFTSIMPDASKSIIQTMSIFGITMGGVLGFPYPLIEFYGSDSKKAYKVGGIPLWSVAVSNFISSVLHLFIMSMIIFFSAPIIFSASLPPNIPFYLLSLILLIITSLSIGLIFGVFIKNISTIGITTQLVFLPSIMLSGIMFPTSLLPNTLKYIGKLFPATWGYSAMCSNDFEITNIVPLLLIFTILVIITMVKLKNIHYE